MLDLVSEVFAGMTWNDRLMPSDKIGAAQNHRRD